MRIAILTAFVAGTLAAGPMTQAQTYDPGYPVCMKVYGPVGYNDCRYSSMEICKQLASGRSAECIVNPYFAGKAAAPSSRRVRRAPRYD
jgi:hypothetical protein